MDRADRQPEPSSSVVAQDPQDGERLRAAAYQMAVIRRFEERIETLFFGGKIRGSVHLGIGQEAVAVGACQALSPDDRVAATYRGHSWALAKGIDVDAAFAEMFGRETGTNRGRGGSKHIGDSTVGVLPSNAIVAAGVPIACGLAWHAQRSGTDDVTLSVFGDGAMNQAAIHEAFNLAAVFRLPVVFICENNLYSEMTPIEEMVTVDQLAERASGYGMPAAIVDGMDFEAVREAVKVAVSRARDGGGPTFVEAMTYRYCGHMPTDREVYRTKDEVASWRDRDPLATIRDRLATAGLPMEEIEGIFEAANTAVEAAETFAKESPLPDPATLAEGMPPWSQKPVNSQLQERAGGPRAITR